MRRSTQTAIATVAALALGLSSPVASAEPPAPIELVWRAPKGCPGKKRVLDEIARMVGPSPRPIQAEATVVQEGPSRWRARVELSGEISGVRQLTGDSCDLVARAAALIIALAIDPQAASVLSRQIRDAEQRGQRPAGPEPPAPDRPRPPPPEAQERPAPPGLQGVLFSGVLGEQALVPGVAAGSLVGGGIQYAWLRFDLALAFVPHASSTPSGPYRADFTAGGIAARSCFGPRSTAVEASLCLGLRASRLWARGVAVPESYSRHADLLAVGIGPLVRWPAASPWAAEAEIEAVIPLNRPEFVIENSGTVYRPPAVGGAAALALGYRF